MNSADEECPVCKMNRYLNPNMKLLVSPCYHKMCETCIERKFDQGSGPCPICGAILRKTQFIIPIFEDLVVEKEIRIRKRLNDIYFKEEGDFERLEEFNDYLENIESLIFEMLNEPDWKVVEDRIEELRKENQKIIQQNQQKMADKLQSERTEMENEAHRKEQQKLFDIHAVLEHSEHLNNDTARGFDPLEGCQSLIELPNFAFEDVYNSLIYRTKCYNASYLIRL